MRRAGVVLTGTILGALAGAGIVATRRAAPPSREPRFEPDAVARIETEGWRAYYDRRFLDGFRLLMELARSEFGLRPADALRASYFAMRGQIAYAGERGDAETARHWMTRYYAVSPHRAGVSPADLATAEIDYWIVHRRLVKQTDKTELIESLARLHALLFGGKVDAMRPSAEQRTQACNAVDRITGRTSTDIDEDWRLVREHLASAYRLAVDAAAA